MKALSNLESATVAQLRKLCFVTGIPSGGSKPTVIETLRNKFMSKSVLEYKTPNDGLNFRILSIDMGIRNFAFTKLELDKQLPFNSPPLVNEWTKFDINEWASQVQVNSFEPEDYAKVCHRLVEEVLLPQGDTLPDAILIERQRTRTAGSSAVQEWVMRVNMIEAMLHALIYTRVKAQKGRVDVVSTSPQRMAHYWKPEEAETRIRANESKKHRIDVVEKWLGDSMYPQAGVRQAVKLNEQRFKLSKEVAATSSGRQRWLNQVLVSQSEYAKVAGGPGKSKVDDLTDSLLHAVSWLEWQQNRMILKLEMLSDLKSALDVSEKMYASHFKEIKFLSQSRSKPKRKPRESVEETMRKAEEAVRGATERLRSKNKTEEESVDFSRSGKKYKTYGSSVSHIAAN